ncbi:MAG: energy transducer TonB, partial [bacterium]|nr:energy transducer TonB [bacterium]
PRLTLSRLLSGGLLVLALAAPVSAQNRLYALHAGDKNYHAVHKVIRSEPYFLQEGKLVEATGKSLALKPTPEYLPLLITVRDLDTKTEFVHLSDVGTNINNQFDFSAKFESSYPLEDVFLVLELEFSDSTTAVFVYEIGRLKPQVPQPFSVFVPMGRFMGAGQMKLHLFVGGDEVFTSWQPAAYREGVLDQMIAKRVAALQDSGPKPFYVITPKYPEALRQAGQRASAVVTMRITPQGTVEDLRIDSASDSAFGEGVLAAVRQWRFVPQVKAGQAVETRRVSLPFEYDPAEAAANDKG